MVTRQVSSQFYREVAVSVGSTEAGYDLGFNATYGAVLNDRNGSVYVRFDSDVPSTGGIRVSSGQMLEFHGLTSKMAISSTTTSTGTTLRAWAFGG